MVIDIATYFKQSTKKKLYTLGERIKRSRRETYKHVIQMLIQLQVYIDACAPFWIINICTLLIYINDNNITVITVHVDDVFGLDSNSCVAICLIDWLSLCHRRLLTFQHTTFKYVWIDNCFAWIWVLVAC